MPDYTIDANVNTVTITSLEKITLQVGANSIVIDTSGITLKCLNLNLEADVQTQLKSVMLKEQISGIKDSTIALYKQA